jgi:hypothetical protein
MAKHVLTKEEVNESSIFEHACTGYLGHPFKYKPVETEKDPLPLLANRGGLVYNPKSSTASSCTNDDILL